jgi:short-subunit dehydrogenase
MEALATTLRGKHGVDIVVIEADLAAHDGPSRLVSTLEERGIHPTILVNNAGFGLHGLAIELPLARQLEMIDLNVRALTALAVAIGAKMATRGSGAIVNLASTGSFQPTPYVAAYAATKAYVLSFSHALAWELAPRGVRVLTFCPGATRTEFFEANSYHVSQSEGSLMSSERCVALALHALDRNKRVVVPGLLNAIVARAARVFPQSLVVATAGRHMKPASPTAVPSVG